MSTYAQPTMAIIVKQIALTQKSNVAAEALNRLLQHAGTTEKHRRKTRPSV